MFKNGQFTEVFVSGLTFITVFVTVGWTASVGVPIFSLDDFPDWAIPNNQSLASNFRKCL